MKYAAGLLAFVISVLVFGCSSDDESLQAVVDAQNTRIVQLEATIAAPTPLRPAVVIVKPEPTDTPAPTPTPQPSDTPVPPRDHNPSPATENPKHESECGPSVENHYTLGNRQTLESNDLESADLWFDKGGLAITLQKGDRWSLEFKVKNYDKTLEYYIEDANGTELLQRKIRGSDEIEFRAPYDSIYRIGLFNPSWFGKKTVEIEGSVCR